MKTSLQSNSASAQWKFAAVFGAKPHGSLLTLISAMALIFAHCARADTATTAWNGGTTVWGLNTNWAGNQLPDATHSALFNSSFSNQPTLGAGQTTEGIWLAAGVGQDVTINSASAQILTITGNATLSGTSNAGIFMNDSTNNHNLTIGSNTSILLSNNTGFYNQEATGTLTISGGLDLNGKTLTIGGGATSTGNVTISGNITSASSGAITIYSGGTVTLSGANSYTGNTTLTGGTLQLADTSTVTNGGLGSGGGTLVWNSGTLKVASSGAAQSISNNVTLTAQSSLAGSQSLTITGTFTNSGGNQQLNDNLTAGTLTLAGTVNLSESSGAGRTLTLNGSGANLITISGLVQNYNGVGGGAGEIEIGGSQVLTLNNSGNTFSGGVFLFGSGTLVLANSGAAGTGPIWSQSYGATIQAATPVTLANAFQINTGHNMTFSGANSISIGSFTNGGGNGTLYSSLTGGAALTITGNVNLSEASGTGRTFTLSGASNITINGAIQDYSGGVGTQHGSLTITNTGTVNLQGSNTYGGLTTMNASAGTLVLSGNNSGAGGVTLTNGKLVINNNNALGAVGGTLTISAGTIDSTVSGISNAIANPIAINGNFTFGGSNDLNLGLGAVAGSFASRTITLNGTGRTLTLGGEGGIPMMPATPSPSTGRATP